MMYNKNILITGGTGSFGVKFTETILKKFKPNKLIIFSRDELKQSEMSQRFGQDCMRYFIGDIRDFDRLKRACEGVDVIVHAAALKQVDTAELNPPECIKTNIGGAQNLIHAAIDCGVKDVIALSTDKACAPINLYGATKLVSDKLFIAANNFIGSKDIRLSVVRYGNVMGSRGSVIPFFLKKRKEGVLPITHEKMTRFNISLQKGVDMVLFALNNHLGGEIFVPKISSYRIMDVAAAIGPECRTEIIGLRPGEKIHEEMITDSDSLKTIDLGKYYVILPSISESYTELEYLRHHKAKKVPFGFRYNSETNDEWETVDSLKALINEYLDISSKEENS